MAKEGEEFRGVGFFGEDGADEGHAVGAEEGAAEVFEGGEEIATGGAGVDGGLGELEGAEGGGGKVGFAGPAAVDGGFADAGGEGDVIERHAAVALLGEVAEGDFENAPFGFRVAGAAGGSFLGDRCNHRTMLTIYNDTIQYRIVSERTKESRCGSGLSGQGMWAGRWGGGGRGAAMGCCLRRGIRNQRRCGAWRRGRGTGRGR